jgi:hypothetical protein
MSVRLCLRGLQIGETRAPALGDMKPSSILLLSLAIPVMSQAQLLTFGVKGGMPAQTPLGSTDDRMPFVLGPTVTVRLFSQLSLESGVTFTRMGQNNSSSVFQYPANTFTQTFSSERGLSVEVPVLAKLYALPERHTWRPFVVIGPTIRHTHVDNQYQASILSGTSIVTVASSSFFSSNRSRTKVDPVAGVGVDLKAGRFHMEPEVRYSFWRVGQDIYPVRKNQVDFLMGFRF